MRREFSAGVVLVRRMHGRWWLAAVRPQGKRAGIWALPKGLVDPGEKPPEAALRDANAKFVRRFGRVEEALAKHGRKAEDATLEEMDLLWDEAKASEPKA